MSLDLSDEYLVFDGTEPVTLTYHRAAGDNSRRVDHALREPVKIQVSAGEWIISDKECFWNLWKKEVGSIEPIQNDRIKDCKGKVWVIQDVENPTLATRFRCRCVLER